MKSSVIETAYPITFREEESTKLGTLLKNRRSVTLIGMPRVGISSFLRFFLSHNEVSKTYIKQENHFFIPVDLNDLVERETYPFWILTLKRIADAVERGDVDKKIKKQISLFFLDSIQTQDLFLTIDYVRKSINFLVENGFYPTIFFLRFDRIMSTFTSEFYANLEGLIEGSNRKLSYVFTSSRSLDVLAPSVFSKHSLTFFSDNVYIRPNNKRDTQIILDVSKKSRGIKLSEDLENKLITLVDGYTQYLQYALITLQEQKGKTKEEIRELLLNDERISLQSEEIWENLLDEEREMLIKILNQKKLNQQEKKESEYLIKTGIFDEETLKIFSPIFEYFIKIKETEKKRDNSLIELTKKELLLLNLLEQNINQVCEREQIIEAVWPEALLFGVSDWAIDRLIARLRGKLKNQNKKYEIITVKTRGYKLIR